MPIQFKLESVANGVILNQGAAEDGAARRLRPFRLREYDPYDTGSDVYYLVDGAAYPATHLLTYVLDNEFRDPAPSLPAPVPFPASYTTLSPDARSLLLLTAEGRGTVEHNRVAQLGAELFSAGFEPLPVTGCTEILIGIQRSRIEQRNRALGLTPGENAPVAIITSDPPELNATRTNMRRWPFSQMQVGQTVEIPADDATAGQNAAHAIGSIKGWKFRTRRIERSRNLIVTRVS